MNALRQFVVASDSGSILISLPPEYRQQRLEIIVLPMDETSNPVDKYSMENMDKLQKLEENDKNLCLIMDKISSQATAKGLTEEILNDILKDPL